MKYGLIVFFKTDNIGDDIQSYAMEKFLPHLDYLIDREHLDSFYTQTGEKVAAFLGGWYLHRPINWPPSPFLKILPISFNLSNGSFLVLSGYGKDWLKEFSSVGCRDESTMKLLEDAGITAYLSGCFTLTIEPFANVNRHEKIVLVDLPEEIVTFVKEHTKKEVVVVSHEISYETSEPYFRNMPEELIKSAKEHLKEDTSINSHYPVQSCPVNWNYRSALVEEILKFYQGASLVVTSRLHVSLPCLAFGTPVLLVRGGFDKRFSTYLPYINQIEPEKLLAGDYLFDFDKPKANPGSHEKFAEKLKRICSDFILSCECDNIGIPRIDVETWLNAQKRILRLKLIFQMLDPNKELPNPSLRNSLFYRI